MKRIKIGMLKWLNTRTCTAWVILAMVLSVLCGCAGRETVAPEPVVPESPATQEPKVAKLADGRKGFVITEVSRLDDAARRDFRRAVVMLNDGHYEQAAGLLDKVVQKSPGVSAPYINLAIAYRHLDNLEQAETHLKAALDLVPGHPAACNEYGMLYRKTGRFAEARAMYEKVLDRFPEFYPAHRNLGILCDLYLGDLECALEHYEIYSLAKPEDEKVQLWIADLRNRLKRR